MKKTIQALILLLSIVTSIPAHGGQTALTLVKPGPIKMPVMVKKELLPLICTTLDQRPSLPKKFRAMHNKFKHKTKKMPSRVGLTNLRASGSQQFSVKELGAIKRVLSPYNVIVLDLREEQHGFIKGSPTWFFQNVLEVDDMCTKSRIKTHKTIAQSERSVAKNLGMGYIRLTITDWHIPRTAEVNQFIEIVKHLKPNQWLHVHCWWGHGRTTTILCMYDMLINAHRVSFDDILLRQWALGGIYVGSDNEKVTFLKQFYCYAQARQKGFTGNWSAWLVHQKNQKRLLQIKSKSR